MDAALLHKNGNVEGTKLIVKWGTLSQIVPSTIDRRFMTLPFTSLSDEAICCFVIFTNRLDKVIIMACSDGSHGGTFLWRRCGY